MNSLPQKWDVDLNDYPDKQDRNLEAELIDIIENVKVTIQDRMTFSLTSTGLCFLATARRLVHPVLLEHPEGVHCHLVYTMELGCRSP